MTIASTSTSTMDELDPATLFNFASLHLHVPCHAPAEARAAPPPATSSSQIAHLGPDDKRKVDEWVSKIAEDQERNSAYLARTRSDETLSFYLVIKLPRQPTLDRAQAAAFFLPSSSSSSSTSSSSVNSAPHLLLTADASFVEGYDGATPVSVGETRPRPSLRPETHDAHDHDHDHDHDGDDPHQPHFHLSASTHSHSIGLGIGRPPSVLPSLDTANLSLLGGPKVPLTPSPLPTKRDKDLGYVKHVESVPLWSCTFDPSAQEMASDEEHPHEPTEGKGKGKETSGRVWVGRQGGDEGDGPWIGVWEFRGHVAYVRSQLVLPRLCLTLNVAFRDDPGLGEMMKKLGRDGAVGAGADHPDGDGGYDSDEYLVESFEDVNLLEGLSSVFPNGNDAPLHLPASRLPQPFPSPIMGPTTSRRPSRAMTLVDASTSGLTDGVLHPSIRRAVQRVLPVRSPIIVRMRAVPCPIHVAPPLTTSQNSTESNESASKRFVGGGGISSMGCDDPNEQRGLVMCVEVEGFGGTSHDPALESKEEAFEILSVEVEIAGATPSAITTTTTMGNGVAVDPRLGMVKGSMRSDVLVKPIGQEGKGAFPLVIGSTEQHNFLYAITVAPDAAQDVDVGFVRTIPAQVLPPLIPLVVATSPSQRFASRFGTGDGKTEGNEVERTRDGETRDAVTAGTSANLRNVTIVVRGRPVKASRTRTRGAYKTEGDDQPLESTWTNEDYVSATAPFASRWNTTLDVSSFAYRAPPRKTTFEHRERVNPFTLPPAVAASTARAARQSLIDNERRKTVRNSSQLSVEAETIAGSKRYTMASLAAMAARSPVLARHGGHHPSKMMMSDSPRSSMQINRALPSVPGQGQDSLTKRYFSLPPGGSPRTNAFASRPRSPFTFNPTNKVETPPPGWRASFPASLGGGTGAEGAEGTKWNGSGSTNTNATRDEPGRTSHQDAPAHRGGFTTTTIDHGQILVSVTLMPLRAIKKPHHSAVTYQDDNIAGDQDVDDEVRSLPSAVGHRASFKFPSPLPSPSPAAGSPQFQDTSSPKLDLSSPTPDAVESPQYRAPRVGLLDVFLVEVFVVNRSDQVKRFTVGVPAASEASDANLNPNTKAWYENPNTPTTTALQAAQARRDGRINTHVASLVALENDVRIGPLLPRSCASVTLRFLAIRPGAHALKELRMVDLATGLETRLNKPLAVVVEA
ncbi:BQ2448_7323 [Microbotryum intermedium]|uniref:BQ2448_7323 protein n=1 Tax=Microbotryum intermedium TaxID=269621 RepID=A0A238FJH8_9BASI|nr:BQ2448_7323 [Microbotryum intermedium]